MKYTRERAAIDAVQNAFEDLQKKGVLHRFNRKNVTGPRKKLLDVIFTILPSFDYCEGSEGRQQAPEQWGPEALAGRFNWRVAT